MLLLLLMLVDTVVVVDSFFLDVGFLAVIAVLPDDSNTSWDFLFFEVFNSFILIEFEIQKSNKKSSKHNLNVLHHLYSAYAFSGLKWRQNNVSVFSNEVTKI